jgi:DNA-binding transcriptional MerR regulator
MEKSLPAIPAKRYFTIGEVSELCAVKPYVLRYWEQEFTQLKPMKRRGNRRYYQHHEVLLIRRIRELLYDHGFTISGARNRLTEGRSGGLGADLPADVDGDPADFDATVPADDEVVVTAAKAPMHPTAVPADSTPELEFTAGQGIDGVSLRSELLSIRELLTV